MHWPMQNGTYQREGYMPTLRDHRAESTEVLHCEK